MTTEFSETAATPNGHLLLTSHAEQQRTKKGEAWAALDAGLAANSDGTYSPRVSASSLVLSKGGSGPLATMTSTDGKKLSLTAPFLLPAPTVDGDSLLYPLVAPDTDLKVTATKAGGLTTVLILKTKAAAADPAVKNLHFATAVDGVTLEADQGGNLAAKGADGQARWTAPTPQMWDSTAPTVVPVGMQSKAAAGGTVQGADLERLREYSDASGPGRAAKVATMPVTAGANGVDLTPDQDLITHGTAPFYVDPAWVPWAQPANAWTWVQSAYPGTSNWKRTGGNDSDHPGVGVCAYYPNGGSCSPADKYRSFYQFDINPIYGAVVHYATMNMEEYVSADWTCGNTYPLNLYLTSAISSDTTWSNQPWQVGGSLGSKSIGGSGHTGCYNNVPFSYDITGTLQQYTNNGQLTFGLYGDESNQYAFKRFTYQPSLSIEYDRTPNVPTDPGVRPVPKTVNPSQTTQSCGDGVSTHWAWLGAGSDQNGAVTLNATISSLTQGTLYSWSHIWDYNLPGVPDVDGGYSPEVPNGWNAPFTVKQGVIKDGHAYGYSIMASDQLPGVPWSSSTPTCYFKVDLTPPTISFPATVADTSKQFPPSGNGQAPKIYAGQSGAIPITVSDPNPSGLYTSGPACLRWSWDPQLADAAWQCGSTMPTSQIQVTPGRWGTNVLYVQAEDNAGNLSPIGQYSFYVPWNPNSPAPVFGDVNGDAVPDIVTTDPNGDLRAYSIPATSVTAPLAARKASSPDGDSWANYTVTHRGSLRGGMNIDDLLVHKAGDANLYFYKNPGNTGVAGVFDSHVTLAKPSCDPALTDCTGYRSADWSTTLAISASGDPTTTGLDPSKKFLNRTGLFTIETEPGGDGALWFYPTVGDARFGSPTKLAATGWKNRDLLSPGDWAGQGHPGLWSRDRGSGDLRGQTFTTGTVTVTDPFGGSVAYPTIKTLATDTSIGNVATAGWPVLGSNGDLTGIGSPTLWGVTPNGILQTWTGHSTTAAPYFTWTTGHTNVVSLYGQAAPIAFAAPGGTCMDVSRADPTPGTAVQLWGCTTTSAQSWSFQADGSVRALGGCLDATGGNTANGTQLLLWTCVSGAGNQIFLPRPDGSLYNPYSGRCVDVPNGTTTNGARLQLWDCTGGATQKWTLPVRSS
ncbi:ricin-type beta-trefoil lectin domain protein [Kitasatospora sp. NPDC092948]|uniref:ricin-type beta-trefoil lectin domain protein n=1 Tax=Kitasatospora sp. NPDC092948 TaxID=3364088 RepID=UPI00381E491C